MLFYGGGFCGTGDFGGSVGLGVSGGSIVCFYGGGRVVQVVQLFAFTAVVGWFRWF